MTKYLSRLCSIPALFYWSCVFRWTWKFQVHRGVWNFVSQKLTTSLSLSLHTHIYTEPKYAVFNYYHFNFYKCLNGMFFYIYQLIERSSLRNLLSGIGYFSLSLPLFSQSSMLFKSKSLNFIALLVISHDLMHLILIFFIWNFMLLCYYS